MATTYASNNPLTITVNDNTVVRAVFKQVVIDENEITVENVQSTVTWRDCVTGELKTGNPPSDYVQVAYEGAGGGTCWEPRAVIGFEPNLDEVLTFDWRRGTTAYPEAKSVQVTNPSSTPFEVKVTTNPNIIVTPQTFTVGARSSATMTVRPTAQLFDTLADGISTIQFKIELTEVI